MARRKKGDAVSGWLCLDKPYDLTSTTAVSRVRRAFNAQKGGHAGTLDPLATGILNKADWEFHFVGREIPSLLLAGQIEPRLHHDLAGESLAALFGTVDLGLSLRYSPHPGYATLALAASHGRSVCAQ